MDLAGFAGAIREIAGRCEASLAVDACRMGAREYLTALQEVTPVQSGALRSSEHIWRVSGSGASATADVGPDIIYDRFRNDGGTIRSKGPWPLRNRSTGQVFGRVVHQAGSHYMERSVGPGQAALSQACRVVADSMIEL